MKNKISIIAFIIAGIFTSLNSIYAQVSFTEDVDGISNTAGYHSDSYVGVNGLVWSYIDARSTVAGGGDVINGINSIMLKPSKGSISSPLFVDGVANLSFKARQSFSKLENDRTMQVQLWDENLQNLLHSVDLIYKGIASEGEMTLQEYTLPSLNIEGKCIFMIVNTTAVAKSEISIDDISWTSYSAAMPIELTALSSNQLKVEFDQDVTATTVIVDNFSLQVGNETQAITSVNHQEGNVVVLTMDGNLTSFDDESLISVNVNGVANEANGLLTSNADISFKIEKPKVISDLEYVDFSTVKVNFSKAVNALQATTIGNYILGGTGGASGNPSNIVMESETVAVLTVPSTENYEDGMTLEVTVNNVADLQDIWSVEEPNNMASIIIDRTPPEVLPELEFVNMETLIVRFSEPIVQSENLNDYVLGGTSGVVGNALGVSKVNETSLELLIADLTPDFLSGNSLTVTINNVTDIAGNTIKGHANIATYVMDDEVPVFAINDVTNVLHRSALFSSSINKAGEIFWSVFDDSKETVTIDEILNEEGEVNGSEVNGFGVSQLDFKVDQLIWNTGYKLFGFAISREGSMSSVVSTSFQTMGPDVPFDDEELGEYKTCTVSLKNGRIVLELNDYSTIDFNRNVTVYDLSGKPTYSGKMSGSTLLLPKLVSGIYMVVIQNGSDSEVHKILVTE